MMKKILLSLLTLIAFVFINSCSLGDSITEREAIKLDPTETVLKYDSTKQFQVIDNGSIISATKYIWRVSDIYRGSVSQQGLFKANKIGELEVTAEKNGMKLSSKIVIKPYYTFFKEPILSFGKTRAEIKKAENRKIANETYEAVLYEGENDNLKYVGYYFDSNDRMTNAVLLISKTLQLEKILTFYVERHQSFGYQYSVHYFKSIDEPIGIGLRVDSTLGLIATYTKL